MFNRKEQKNLKKFWIKDNPENSSITKAGEHILCLQYHHLKK